MGFGHVLFIGIIFAAVGAVSWFGTRPGQYQVLIRTSALLTLSCLYLMWAVTYTAQMNPLVVPVRTLHKASEE